MCLIYDSSLLITSLLSYFYFLSFIFSLSHSVFDFYSLIIFTSPKSPYFTYPSAVQSSPTYSFPSNPRSNAMPITLYPLPSLPSIPTLTYRSRPSNSTNLLTTLTTSSPTRSSSGSRIFLARTSSSINLRRLIRTPILAQPRRRSQLSMSRPRPRVSRVMGPEKRRRVYALKAGIRVRK